MFAEFGAVAFVVVAAVGSEFVFAEFGTVLGAIANLVEMLKCIAASMQLVRHSAKQIKHIHNMQI